MNNKKGNITRPPRLAEMLLKLFLRNGLMYHRLGEFQEVFEFINDQEGIYKARLWYWKHTLKSIPNLIYNSFYWGVTMLSSYFKIAWRNLVNKKLFAVINLMGLAFGIACFMLISLWIVDELNYDNFHDNKGRLYTITIKHPTGIYDPNVPYAFAPRLASEFPEFEGYTRSFSLGTQQTCSFKYIKDQNEPVMFYEKNVKLVDNSFFEMFTFPFVYGTPNNALDNPLALVLRREVAEKYFGNNNPVGKELILNNETKLSISAVVDVPANSSIQFDYLAPLQDPMTDNWNWSDPSFVLLTENCNVADLSAKIEGKLNEYFPAPLPDQLRIELLPITDLHLFFGRMTYVYIFGVIALFILLIACVNYMNLTTASSSNRAKEVGLRKVTGADRSQLVYQFLGESVFMSVIATSFGIILASILLPSLNKLTAKELSLFAAEGYSIILFIVSLVIIVALIAGAYPAVYLTSMKPIDSLRSTSGFKNRRSTFRVISVVGQFAISIILIISSILVFKQINFAQDMPLGFQTDHVIRVPINPTVTDHFDSYQSQLKSNPNISFVTAGNAYPYDNDHKTRIDWPGKDPDFQSLVRYSIVNYEFAEVFDMEIVDGRSFDRQFSEDNINFMINETAAAYMNMVDPVGKQITMWGVTGTIIGVVKDFHHVSLHREILPHIFVIHPGYFGALKHVFIKINSSNLPETLEHIKTVSSNLAPDYPFEYLFLDEDMNNLYDADQRLGKILGYFAFIAIFISMLGIFGLSIYTSENRTKEIGIRKTMGASVSSIVILLSKEFSRWVLIANIIGCPIAYYLMDKWLDNFAYQTDLSWYIFLIAGAAAFLLAFITIGYQSIKAASANPVESIKYE